MLSPKDTSTNIRIVLTEFLGTAGVFSEGS